MVSFRSAVVSIVSVALIHSLDVAATRLPPSARAADVINETTIPALLRKPSANRSLADLEARQSSSGSCDVGYLPCDSGDGCCQVGYYCGVWGGKRGCCRIGRTCRANDDPCEFENYFPCSGENFCCPNGSTCSRDSAGSPQCDDTGSGTLPSLTRPSLTSTFTRTSSSTAFTSINDGGLPPRSTTSSVRPAFTSSLTTSADSSGSTLRPENAFGNGASSNEVIWTSLAFVGLTMQLALSTLF
ncbi:hypothetical protein BDQ12DRAFT_712762 [Crucibulum laeve]|uniref:GPI anchored protein n=1 Tax=Crucibulum laeve TaxID=68775 RepID=A0A5C3M0U0_9AGAR|nr:hypothetical protein BDQ12DRAFT_712762 [Crucibulum laeve]